MKTTLTKKGRSRFRDVDAFDAVNGAAFLGAATCRAALISGGPWLFAPFGARTHYPHASATVQTYSILY